LWFELGEYLRATPLLNELRILTWLKTKPDTPQARLAAAVGLAPAMVNTYIRRFSEAGLISSVHRSAKRVDYELTPEGERKRSYHLISFLSQTYSLFDEVLGDLRKRIDAACPGEQTRVMIYGAGETGRMAYLAIQGLPRISVVGVIDDDPAKIGQRFFSFTVEGVQSLGRRRPEKILVASWRYSDVMAAKIALLAAEEGIEVARLVP
jgi:FlaA1/EpsC-like NDP-sugar epimerase